MIQIIFMAVLIGCSLLVLGNNADEIKKIANQLNAVIMQSVLWICDFLPYYIFASLVVLLWKNGTGMFVTLWKPLLVYVSVMIFIFTAKLVYVCIKLNLRFTSLFLHLKSTMLIGLTTASSSAALGTMFTVNEKKLGISKKLSRFGTPFANLLHCPSDGTLLAVILYYLSECYGVPVNFGWLFTAWIMCSLLSMTIPPVSGGTLAVTVMLMTQLNIPQEGLAVAGIMAIIMDFPSTATRIGITHLDLLLQAHHLQLWKCDVIKKSS